MKYFVSIILLLASTSLFAQEKYTVSGRINTYNPEGRIYVFLCDEEAFQTPLTGIDTVSFWVNYDKRQVEYEFKNIPPGKYAIRAYQDVNGNHKLDKWLLGPKEPWGYSYSGKMKFPPNFNDVSFDLYYDMRINIILGK